MSEQRKAWSAGVPSEEELRALVAQGLGPTAIGRQYGVADNTARYWLTSRGIELPPARRINHRGPDGNVPWKLDAADLPHRLAQLLRLRGRIQAGDPRVRDTDIRAVKELEENLAAAGHVIAYRSGEGFFYVDRDPQRDAPDSIVRVPRSGKRSRQR